MKRSSKEYRLLQLAKTTLEYKDEQEILYGLFAIFSSVSLCLYRCAKALMACCCGKKAQPYPTSPSE